jgi:hypothetical protein
MQYRQTHVYSGLALVAVMAAAGCAKGGGTAEVAPAIAPSLAAHAVYERMVEAVGGRAALEQYTSSRAVGEFSLPAQGIQGNVEVFTAAPNYFLLEVDIPGIGTVRSGYDGEVGWSVNPATGPMILEGNQLHQFRQQADFLGPLNVEAYIDSASVVEETEFDGKMCQKVRVVTKWGEEYFDFYDVATGLPAGSIRTQESPMGAMEATTVVSDYKDFGGILGASRIVQSVMGMDQIITINTIEYETVDLAVFELPDEIKAMMK